MKKVISTILLLSLLFPAMVSATAINYTVDSLGGDSYQYNYTFHNDTLGFDVDWFSIFFDVDFYNNLAVTASHANWDSLVFQPDGFHDGVFDTFALGPLIASGETLSGFSVSFDWLGDVSGPGPEQEQYFEVYNGFDADFNPIVAASGLTASPSATVPEASSLSLLLLGLATLWFRRRLA